MYVCVCVCIYICIYYQKPKNLEGLGFLSRRIHLVGKIIISDFIYIVLVWVSMINYVNLYGFIAICSTVYILALPRILC